jgi:hypothetical protein
MLLESSLISLFSAFGGCYGNQVSPLRRQEVPPLWLNEVMRQFTDGIRSLDCDDTQQETDPLLEQIINLLDETEGQGCRCLTPAAIAERCEVSRDRVVSCMKKNGLNP